MSRVLALIIAVTLSLAWTTAASAAAEGQASANAKTIKTLEQKMKTNSAFLKAAAHIIDAGGKDAASFLKMAEMAAVEAEGHYKKGEYEFAIEDIAESTHLAMSAIILSKNQQDGSIRDVVINETLVLKEKREIEKKETMISGRKSFFI